MGSTEVSEKPRTSRIARVASLFCLGEPRMQTGAKLQKSNAERCKTRPQARGSQADLKQDQVDLLVEARSRLVVGTPMTLPQPTPLQALEEELRNEKQQVADLTGNVQRLTDALNEERAHSAYLQAQVTDLDSKMVVGRTVTAAVQRAALRAELEEQKVVADMVAEVMHRAALHEVHGLHEELLEAAQRIDLELKAKTDELAEAKKAIQQHQAENAILYQACFQNLPTILEDQCPMVNNIGCGGGGTVDLHTMSVAVKKPRTAADVRRLEEEHLIMATMQHPCIPRAFASWQPNDGSAQGLIMRYIPGGSLYKQLRLCVPRGIQHRRECLSILIQLLDVLKYAHGLGRVHADVKTTNLMYRAGQLTVIDWGVSYLITQPAIRWRGTVGALRAVAAVEPWKGGFDDDVRGFWAVAYELLTAQSVFDILKKHYADLSSQPSFEEHLTQLCKEANLNPDCPNSRLLCAEYQQYIRIDEVDFLDLAADKDMPRPFLEMLMHGLSPAVSRGDATTSSLEDIQSVLVASIQELEAKMKPQLVPDTAYSVKPEANTAAPARQTAVRRRLDFGGEAETEAAAAACAHMPPAPEAADTCKWRNFVAAAAAARADEPPVALDIGGQEEPPAAAAAAACTQMLAEEGLEVTERQEHEPVAAAPRQGLHFVMDFCKEVEPQPAAAACEHMLPDSLVIGEREKPAAAAATCAHMLPDSLDFFFEWETPAAAAATCAHRLPDSLDISEREKPAAAAATCEHMLPDSLDISELEKPAAAAATCELMLPDSLDISELEKPAAAPVTCADMLPASLHIGEREMPEAAAAAPEHMLPFTFDFRDLRRRWARAVSPNRAEPGGTGEPDAAAGTCAHMPAGPLYTVAACGALLPQHIEATYIQQLPAALDIDYREELQPAAMSPLQLRPHTLETPDEKSDAKLAMLEKHVIDLGFLD
ncbi:probable Aurora kinase B at N-terminal half [Coccomyxa sp. Obi]|nr:probable Aurora kinase B at N-terminal half [Coccomyxa sp. Obi]